MIAGALFGLIALAASIASSVILYRVAGFAQADLAREMSRAKEHAALLERDILRERRLTARERWLLSRVAKAVLPRTISPEQRDQLVSALKGKVAAFNICFVNRTEPRTFALDIVGVLQGAGAKVNLIPLPRDADHLGLTTYTVDEAGNLVAKTFWETAQIGGGTLGRGVLPMGLEAVPKDENCLIVGENDAAFQPLAGQPGEGIDEYGRPDPAP